jgi:hypothetical protein
MPTLYAFRLPQTKTALSAILAETCNQADRSAISFFERRSFPSDFDIEGFDETKLAVGLCEKSKVKNVISSGDQP